MKLTHRLLEMYMFCSSPMEVLHAFLKLELLPIRTPERLIQDRISQKQIFLMDDEVPKAWVSTFEKTNSVDKVVWFEERPQPAQVDFIETWHQELCIPDSYKARSWFDEMQQARKIALKNGNHSTKNKYSVELQYSSCNPRIEPPSFRFVQYPWTFQGPASMQFLTSLPFTEVFFTMIHFEWGWEQALNQALNKGVDEVCYSLSFPPATWALAFQGEGHKRVVSRRWLERGPWYVQRLDNDTTVIYLFDLLAPFHQALPQLQASHQALDRDSGGGYLKLLYYAPLSIWNWEYFPGEVTLKPKENTIRMEVKQDNPLLLRGFTDLCAMRLPPLDDCFYQLDITKHRTDLQDSDVIQHIQCVFFSRELAEKYLYELWLREMECWWVKENGEEVRLDENYQPPPIKKPDWVAEFAQMMEESS